ncbi:Hypp8970 [Branchiostoma lanceolatum]|uniref:Hypp8970 protein n=1 Tax=Branchiostoma lanceolatum TaxID=7740 RepID=A0A8J9ZCI1_BRALA|nr:Hypp8970 [Branchiostoma lanceolatum]
MRSVVAFVSAVLLALQLAPTSALVIRPRRELPDFFSQILQRVKKDAAVDDSSSTGEEDMDKICTRHEDCKEDQFCVPTGPSTRQCRDPSEVMAMAVEQCPPDTLHHAKDGNCRVPGAGPPILPEGTACESDLDCKRGGMCCGYVDGGSRGCKSFQEEGEPCETFYDDGAPWKLPTISREEVGGCCKGGLHCGKELVCIPYEDMADDTDGDEDIPKPLAQDEITDDSPVLTSDNPGKIDDKPEKTDDNSEKTDDT